MMMSAEDHREKSERIIAKKGPEGQSIPRASRKDRDRRREMAGAGVPAGGGAMSFW